jgi:hypothetical protein
MEYPKEKISCEIAPQELQRIITRLSSSDRTEINNSNNTFLINNKLFQLYHEQGDVFFLKNIITSQTEFVARISYTYYTESARLALQYPAFFAPVLHYEQVYPDATLVITEYVHGLTYESLIKEVTSSVLKFRNYWYQCLSLIRYLSSRQIIITDVDFFTGHNIMITKTNKLLLYDAHSVCLNNEQELMNSARISVDQYNIFKVLDSGYGISFDQERYDFIESFFNTVKTTEYAKQLHLNMETVLLISQGNSVIINFLLERITEKNDFTLLYNI